MKSNPFITQVDLDVALLGSDSGHDGSSPAEAAEPIFERFMGHAMGLWGKGHYSEAKLELVSAVAFAKATGLSENRLGWAKMKLFNLVQYLGGFDWQAEETRRVGHA